MKNLLFGIFLISISSLSYAQEFNIFPIGQKAPNVHHTGDVWLNHLAAADENFDFNVVLATFAPDAKLNWHKHPAGQQLYITNGVGYYQERGKEVQVVRKGDVIKCDPNVEHWHASAPNSDFAYLAITMNKPTVWTDTLTAEAYHAIEPPKLNDEDSDKDLIALSKKKWQWMADKDADKLAELFHDKAQFVHMGGSWGKEQEVQIIKSGGIWYKHAEVHKVSVDVMGDTGIVLSNITLVAVVGGNEVSHQFIVTEVYVKEDDNWKLANLSFVNQLKGPPGDH